MSLTYFVALAHDQAARVMERQQLSAAAISASGALPLWTRRELALESFFRECNRRGAAVLMPGDTDSLVPVTSGTGGYDPVPRTALCGRTYRYVEEHQEARDGESLATLPELRFAAPDLQQWEEAKLVKGRGERLELQGMLPLTNYDARLVLYGNIDFRTWMDVYVATEYYFRCNGRCTRSTCSHPSCVTWLLFITLCLPVCFCICLHREPKLDPEPEACENILGQAYLWSPHRLESVKKPSAIVCGACLLEEAQA